MNEQNNYIADISVKPKVNDVSGYELRTASLYKDHYEKYFPNITWQSEPIFGTPWMFLADYWDAKTWMLWHTKLKEKWGLQRANDVFLEWFVKKAPLVSLTTDFRSFDKPFIQYAKDNKFYDGLFTGISGIVGKTAGAGNKVVESTGKVIESAGELVSDTADTAGWLMRNLKTILIVAVIIATIIFLMNVKKTFSS